MIGAVFDLTTGHLLRNIQTPNITIFHSQAQNNEIAFQGNSVSINNYLDLTSPLQPTISTRTLFTPTTSKQYILNNGIDSLTITLPTHCFIKINNIQHEILNGSYIFTSPNAGIYEIKLIGKYQGEISVTVHDIIKLKTQKNNKITENYLTKLYSGITYNNNIYDSNEISMHMISGAAAEGNRNGLPFNFAWKTKDNILIPMDLIGLNGLASAMFAHTNTTFTLKETKKAELASYTILTDILNMDLTI